jgi:hypothetical protein
MGRLSSSRMPRATAAEGIAGAVVTIARGDVDAAIDIGGR